MTRVSTPQNLQVYRQRLEQLHPDDELKGKLVSLIKKTIETHQLSSDDQLTDAHFREILERLHLDDNARFRGRLLSVGIPYVSRYSPWSNQRATGKVTALMGRLNIQTADLQPRRQTDTPQPHGGGEHAAGPLPPPVVAQAEPTEAPAGAAAHAQGAPPPKPGPSPVAAQIEPTEAPAGAAAHAQGAAPPKPLASPVVAKAASPAVKLSAAAKRDRSTLTAGNVAYDRAMSRVRSWSAHTAPSAATIRAACDSFVTALRHFEEAPLKASALISKFESFEQGMYEALTIPGLTADKPTYTAWAKGMASVSLQYGNMWQQQGDIDEAINVYRNGFYAIGNHADVTHNETALMPFVEKLSGLLQGKAESALAMGHIPEAAGYLAECGHLCLTVGNNEDGERLYSDAASHLEKAAEKNRAEGRIAAAKKQEKLAAGVRKECAATLKSIRKLTPQEVLRARESVASYKRAWQRGDAGPGLAVMKHARVLMDWGYTEEAGDAFLLAAELDVHAQQTYPNQQWAVEQAIDNYQRAQTLLASDDARLPGIPKILKELNSLLRDLKYGLGPAGSTSKPEEEKDYAEEADDYAVLGVDPSASLREMTVAKRRLLLQYHPDKAPDRKNAEDMQRREDMSKRINLAVKRLGI